MRTTVPLMLATLLLAAGLASAAVEAEKLAGELSAPSDIAFGPDGTLYWAELNLGNVRMLKDGAPSAPIAHVPTSGGGNGGFLGLAIDPDEPGVLYAFYSMEKTSAAQGKVNRVERIDTNSGERTVLIDDMMWTEFHEGGRLAIGPDGHLYVTRGDNDNPGMKASESGRHHAAQDDGNLRGKILRIDRVTGEAAPDNPGYEDPRVFAKGFRNPFGIHVLDDGRVYVSDNGPASDDRVLLIEPGGNHGWPICQGACDMDGIVPPITYWSESFGTTGVAVRGDTLYVGDFNNGQVRAVDLETGEWEVHWQSDAGPVLGLTLGPDGCLYASTFQAIWRLAECVEPRTDEDVDVEPIDEEVPDESVEAEPPASGAGASIPAPWMGLTLVGLAGAAWSRRRA